MMLQSRIMMLQSGPSDPNAKGVTSAGRVYHTPFIHYSSSSAAAFTPSSRARRSITSMLAAYWQRSIELI